MGIATKMLDIPILKLQGYLFSMYIYIHTHIQGNRKEMSCYPQQWTDAEQKWPATHNRTDAARICKK